MPDYRQVVQRAFERFITARHYNADQIRFLRSVQEVFLKNKKRFFTPQEIRELLALAAGLAA